MVVNHAPDGKKHEVALHGVTWHSQEVSSEVYYVTALFNASDHRELEETRAMMGDGNARMRAAFLLKPRVVEVRDVPRPTPDAGEVLIRVRAVGICGSDMHMYATGRIGVNVVEEPHIMGHEISGEVAALGHGVAGLSVGQRVVVEPGLACGQCHNCRSGRYNLCPAVKFLGVPPYHGGMAEYMVVPAQWAYPLPEGLSFVDGAMAEPLVVALQAVDQGAVAIDSTVAIFGAGPIGLLALQAALVRGARQVLIVDVLESRLKLARDLGATAALNAAAVDVVAEIRRLTGGQGANVVIELSGAPKAITQLFRSASKGATAVLVGIAEDPTVEVEYTNIVRSGIRIETVFRYVNQFPLALDLMARRLIRLAPLVTQTFPLEETAAAFATVQERKSEVTKAVLLVP